MHPTVRRMISFRVSFYPFREPFLSQHGPQCVLFTATNRANHLQEPRRAFSCNPSSKAILRSEQLLRAKARANYVMVPVRSSSSMGQETRDETSGEGNSEELKAPRNQQEVQDELRQLNHIRALVSQLYMALHVPDTYKAEMDNMQKQLDEIRTELQPLEEKKIQLLMRAERRSKFIAWAGLGFMGVQFGFLARLTWWEYSWDIIEPMTYFVTYGTAMGLYAYFLVTRQDYSFPAVTERWTAVAFHKNVRRAKWEMNRYMELRDKLTHLQSEIEKMNMLAPRSPPKDSNLASSQSVTAEKDNAV